jgi:hypothetical protein
MLTGILERRRDEGWASDLGSGLCGFRNVVEATTSGTADDNVSDFAFSHSFDKSLAAITTVKGNPRILPNEHRPLLRQEDSPRTFCWLRNNVQGNVANGIHLQPLYVGTVRVGNTDVAAPPSSPHSDRGRGCYLGNGWPTTGGPFREATPLHIRVASVTVGTRGRRRNGGKSRRNPPAPWADRYR